jgi:hypothetical protein
VAAAMRFIDASIDGSATRDDDVAVGFDWLDYFTIEAIAGATGLDADPLIDADSEFGARGNTDRNVPRLLIWLRGGAGVWLSVGVGGRWLTVRIGALSCRIQRRNDGVGPMRFGAGRRRCYEGRYGRLLAGCGRRLDGVSYGIAVLVDVLNLLGSVGAGGL